MSVLSKGLLLKSAVPGMAITAALGVAAAVPSNNAVVQAQAKPAASAAHIAINGQPVYKVRFGHQMMSLATYISRVEPAAERTGHYVHLVVDRSAVKRGYFVAFSNEAVAARYLHAHGMSTGSQTATSSAVADQRRRVSTSSAHPMTVNGEAVNLAACATGIDYAFFYDGSSCTGSYLSMVSNDQIPHFGTYGFTDKTSSLDVGRCISNVDVWVDGSYTGNHTTFGGDDFYNAMPSGFNNSISSAKTDSSGAC